MLCLAEDDPWIHVTSIVPGTGVEVVKSMCVPIMMLPVSPRSAADRGRFEGTGCPPDSGGRFVTRGAMATRTCDPGSGAARRA
ncbi:hypothetical protein Ate02nite_45330 [Paractinoplanes tereljensis]|uniref:Uncharacterized protein n=1 Tax=Paractinoplanes tereljensis TaxID=571912 RepID=A0A919NNK7_9ACTN|nr:hypothetical protein Ate02nite_45330 [Actinoplanes tereljensis]